MHGNTEGEENALDGHRNSLVIKKKHAKFRWKLNKVETEEIIMKYCQEKTDNFQQPLYRALFQDSSFG